MKAVEVGLALAKKDLSRLVERLEQGELSEVVILCRGRPVAKLVPVTNAAVGKRLGIAKGAFHVPDDIDLQNVEIASLFHRV